MASTSTARARARARGKARRRARNGHRLGVVKPTPKIDLIPGRSRRLRQLLSALPALGLLAGCGSATATHSAATAAGLSTSGASSASVASMTTPAPAGCATTVASTLGTVAARVYHEAATGGDV